MALASYSASSVGSELETAEEKNTKRVANSVPPRGRGKKYVSVAKFSNPEDFEASEIFKN